MQASRQELAEFETTYAKRIDEDAKIVALRSIMLATLFGEAGVLTGKWCITYADFRASIIRFLDHNEPVSIGENELIEHNEYRAELDRENVGR